MKCWRAFPISASSSISRATILLREICWRRGSLLFRSNSVPSLRSMAATGRSRRLQAKLHGMPVMSQNSLKRCLLRYMALGWTGYVPEDCQTSVIILPINIAPWIWGYPHRLVARMEAAGSQVFVAGGYDGTGFSSGVDDLATLLEAAHGFGVGVWTNRIERIGQAAATPAAGSHSAEGR